jgi:hypothetical protein
MSMESSVDRAQLDRPKDRQKSRITNGSALLPGVDGRSPWVTSGVAVVYTAVLPALLTTQGMLVAIGSPYRRMGLLHAKHKRHFGVDGPRRESRWGKPQQCEPEGRRPDNCHPSEH